MVGGWVKIPATMVGRGGKILKLHWVECPKPKFGPENKWIKTSYLESHIYQWLKTSCLLISDFLIERLKASDRKPHSFYEPQLTQYDEKCTLAVKIIFPVGVIKIICTAPFLEAQELHSRSTWKTNVYVNKSPFKNFCVGNVGSLYLLVAK